MIIKRKGIDSFFQKKISISIDNEKQNLLFHGFSTFFQKNKNQNQTIYLEVVKTNEDFKRQLSDDVLIKIEMDNNELYSDFKLNRVSKYIEKTLQANMQESLINKMEILKKELKRMKKEEEIDVSFKINPKYLNKKQEVKAKNSQNNNNNSGESFTDKFKRIPTVYIVDKLVELGIITLSKSCQKNGSEKIYWIDLPDGQASKVSMLSRESIESGIVGNKYCNTRDFNNSKLSSKSSYAFLNRLKDAGVFGEEDTFDIVKKILEVDGKVSFKEFPLVDSENNKVIMGEGGDFINIVNLNLPSRKPAAYYMPKQVNEYKKYLIEERGISKDIIEREFNNKNIGTGNFFSSVNYAKWGVGLFKLGYLDEKRASSKTFETISLDKNNAKKLYRGHLKSIKIKGRSHIIPSENPKATIFTEAVIDNYSLENIFRLSNNTNEKDYHFIGLTSVGNIQGWLEYNLGVKIHFNENRDENDEIILSASYIEKKIEILEDQKEAKEILAKALLTKRIHFVVDETQKWLLDEGNKSLFRLKNTLSKIDENITVNRIAITDPKKRNIDLNDFSNGDGCEDYIIDKTNIDSFLKENNIQSSYKGKGEGYEVLISKNVEKLIPLVGEELLEKVRRRFVALTKTESMIVAFDNDIAALPKIPHLEKLCEILRLEFKSLIPSFKYAINDHNDTLKTFNYLMEKNKKTEAMTLIDNFTAQINRIGLPNDFKEIVEHAKEIDIKKKEKENLHKKNKLVR